MESLDMETGSNDNHIYLLFEMRFIFVSPFVCLTSDFFKVIVIDLV